MSVVRSARSSLGRWVTTSVTPPAAAAPAIALLACRSLHSSAVRESRRKSRFKNIKVEDKDVLAAAVKEKYPEYTAEDMAMLRERYTPAQMEAIEAGQKAVDPKDLVVQGRPRRDPYGPTYVEDYTRLDPRFDVRPTPETPKVGGGGGKVSGPRDEQWPSHEEWLDDLAVNMSQKMDEKTDAQLTRAMVRALRRVRDSHGADMIDMTEEELTRLEEDPKLLEKYVLKEIPTEEDAAAAAAAGGDDNGAGGEGGTKKKDNRLMTEAEVQKLDEAIEAEWKKELELIGEPEVDGGKGSSVSAALASMAPELTPTHMELLQDGPAGEARRLESAVAPDLGKIPGVEGRYGNHLHGDPEDEGIEDALGEYRNAKRVTGLRLREIRSLYCKVLVWRSVANQTRVGKIRSSSIIAVAGNGNGRLGVGMAKSVDALEAASTARVLAIQNMKAVRRYENRTIYGSSRAKFGGTLVEIFSRPPGFGLRVPSRIFEMFRAVGLHDMSARMPRARNPMNSVFATYKALMNQIDPEEIALGRGRKMADARKVYYGGSVY